ncbi:MAG: PEGA domain-containing protein [Myxococcota bacterium]
MMPPVNGEGPLNDGAVWEPRTEHRRICFMMKKMTPFQATALLLSVAVVFTPLAATAQRAETTRILLQDFAPLGVDAEVATAFQERVAGELADRPGFVVVSQNDIRELLTKEVAEDPDCDSQSCLEAAIAAVEARYVLNGSVGAVGGERVVSLTLLDGERARPIGGASATFANDDDTLKATSALLGETFGWDDTPRLQNASFELPNDRTIKVAVMDLDSLGLDEASAKNLTQVLSGSLKQVQGAEIVSQEDIRSLLELEAQRQLLGCDEMSCMAELGGALGVDRMVTGSVGYLGDRYVVSLRLIDPRAARVEARVTESFVGEETQLLPAVRYGGKRLLGALGDNEGTLAVSANETEAALFIDNNERGLLPMPAVDALLPGRYQLVVKKDGYFDWNSDVFIEPGSATTVWVELNERPTPWYKTWWFWTAVGAVAVGATTLYIVNERSLPDTELNNVDFSQ